MNNLTKEEVKQAICKSGKDILKVGGGIALGAGVMYYALKKSPYAKGYMKGVRDRSVEAGLRVGARIGANIGAEIGMRTLNVVNDLIEEGSIDISNPQERAEIVRDVTDDVLKERVEWAGDIDGADEIKEYVLEPIRKEMIDTIH